MNFDARDVTIYVPCFNAEQTVLECLEGLFAQSVTPACVMVIDDCSSEPVASIPGVRVVRHDKNKGLAAARNTALSICRTPLIASVDSDVVAGDTWLESLLEAINSGPYSGVGGMMVEKHVETLGDKWRAAHMSQHWGETNVENPRFLYGANTLFRTKDLRSVGGYDERFRTNDEDRYISEKLYEDGKLLYYTSSGVCHHLRRDTVKTVLAGYWRWHHMKGVKRGDFNYLDGIKNRIKDVNFGIACYRLYLDKKNERHELEALDHSIPWVFSGIDLKMFGSNTGCTNAVLRIDELCEGFCDDAVTVLKQLVLTNEDNVPSDSWHRKYMDEFKKCLVEYYGEIGLNPYIDGKMWSNMVREMEIHRE